MIPIRRRLVLSALVIGSMAPDFPKFFSLAHGVTLGHSLPGVFWFCVPVGLIVFTLFQHLLKKPLFFLLPVTHQKRFAPWLNPFPFRGARQCGLVVVSLVIGALTHLFWDEFTHEHGWFVEAFPFLQKNVFTVRHHAYEIYECLQHLSTVGGIIFLAACYIRFYRKTSLHHLPSMPVISSKVKFFGSCLLMGTPILFGMIIANAHPYRVISWSTLARRAVVASIAIFCFELILFSVLYHFYFRNSSSSKAMSR